MSLSARSVFVGVLTAVAAVWLTGCAGTIDGVDARAIELNKSASKFANEAALLNIVRVMNGEPIRYANLTAVTGHDTYIGVAGVPTFTLGWRPKSTLNTFVFGPNALTVNKSEDFTVNIVDDPATYQALMAPVTPATFGYLEAQGYDQSLIYHLLIGKIALSYTAPQLTEAERTAVTDVKLAASPPPTAAQSPAKQPSTVSITTTIDAKPAANGTATIGTTTTVGSKPASGSVSSAPSETAAKPASTLETRVTQIPIVNDPGNVGQYQQFTSLITAFQAHDFHVETDILHPEDKTGVSVAVAPGLSNVRYRTCINPFKSGDARGEVFAKDSKEVVTCIDSQNLNDASSDPQYVWEIPSPDYKDYDKIEITLRSTFSIYRYIKELAELTRDNKLPSDAPHVVITNDKFGCVVHVSYEGRDWCVPPSTATARNDTMQIIDILHQIVAINSTAQSQSPATATVRTTGS
jgi:hypothetical protein